MRYFWWITTLISLTVLLVLSWPDVAGAYYLAQGNRALAKQEASTALHALEAARYWQPEQADVQRRLAQAYLQAGQPQQALEPAQAAILLAPDQPESQLILGDIYDQLGQAEEAVAHYETGQIGDRAIPLTVNYLRLADQLWEAGRRDEAAAIWRDKVRTLGYGQLYANWRLAQYYADDEVAASSFSDAIRYFPLDSIAPQPEPRLTAYQAQAMLGAGTDGIWPWETLLNIISYRVWQDQSQAAEDLLQALTTARPTDADLHFYRGELYQRRGDWVQAQAAYQQVLDFDSRYAPAYLRLGLVAEAKCEVRSADCEYLPEAATWYERYRQLAPDDLLGLKKQVDLDEVLQHPQASALRAELENLTDDRRIVADMLGMPPDTVILGPNLVKNGGFEEWDQTRPLDWLVANTATNPATNAGLYYGGIDAVIAWDSASARNTGLWLQNFPNQQQHFFGYQQHDLLLEENIYYLVSFYFRTVNVQEDTARTSMVSMSPDLFWAATWLPVTNARWRKFGMLVKSEQPGPLLVRQLAFLYGTGSEWLDQMELKAVRLKQNEPDQIPDLPAVIFK